MITLFLLLDSLTVGYSVILHFYTNIQIYANIPFGFFSHSVREWELHTHTHTPPLVLIVLKLKSTILIVSLLTLLTNFEFKFQLIAFHMKWKYLYLTIQYRCSEWAHWNCTLCTEMSANLGYVSYICSYMSATIRILRLQSSDLWCPVGRYQHSGGTLISLSSM